ncbi:uncharacterized protein LOC126368322 [Pectinophora gossypiella]|uniref:uncharacterized protein LOC126368322 n=1 Tax=Pectinophora gossypiella TaxID=13191 RepID=UPI00214F09B9|nr:uncharacterized protein LOC126368322 [Pectinophora gossypiella]
MFAIIPVNGLVIAIIISAKQKSFENVSKDFMDKIHLYNFLGQIYNNYENRHLVFNRTLSLETVIYPLLPYDYRYNFQNWLIVHLTNVYFVWTGCIIIVIHNSINYALFKDIQAACGFNVTTNYLYNWIADSLLLYQLMMAGKGNLPLYGLMIVVYLGGLIVMSFVLEGIRRQSDNLPQLVYNLDWENMSMSNKKMFLLLLMRTQPALEFIAAGRLRAGVRPMLSVSVNSLSVFTSLSPKE